MDEEELRRIERGDPESPTEIASKILFLIALIWLVGFILVEAL